MNQQTPLSQMQQLVSHWNTLMPPKQASRKRQRDNYNDTMTNTRPRTQAPSQRVGGCPPDAAPETPTNNVPSGVSSY